MEIQTEQMCLNGVCLTLQRAPNYKEITLNCPIFLTDACCILAGEMFGVSLSQPDCLAHEKVGTRLPDATYVQ